MASSLLDEKDLYKFTFQGEWNKVVELYREKPSVHSRQITSSGDTALHMAVNDDREEIVEKLVKIIEEAEENKGALKIKNERGDTSLHRAAIRGSITMCKCILEALKIKNEREEILLSDTNKWGETPVFLAALHNRKLAFLYLNSVSKRYKVSLRRSKDGDNILHCTIKREHFDLAFQIAHLYPELVSQVNEKGMSPLHVLASKPSAFKSGSRLSWWKKIIYYCILVDPLKFDDTVRPKKQQQNLKKKESPKNYQTCYDIAICIGNNIIGKNGGHEPENQPEYHQKIPENYVTCYVFFTSVCVNFLGVLGFGNTFTVIKHTREKHAWSGQILDKLMENPSQAYFSGGSDPKESVGFMADFNPLDVKFENVGKDGNKQNQQVTGDNKETSPEERNDYTPLLVAAKNGVLEVVEKILQKLPVSIHDTSSKNENILHVAVENRQPQIFEALCKRFKEELENKSNLWDDLIQAVDSEDNTILHLAAKSLESQYNPWQIPGSAMQMQWEIKWYQYVKYYVPPHFLSLKNQNNETPSQIFTVGHKDLVKDSSDWLKDTSESCSVVAALVAGVSFATSSAVPGGIDDKTGKPILEGQAAFNVFSITGLIALCFSITALVMFLSILTSRKQARDFRRELPFKLLMGLSSLFVSIASMLVSFCAAHFFVLEDKFKNAVFPIYAVTCLPVSFYAIAQFPLYLDLLTSIFMPVPKSNQAITNDYS